MESLGFGLRKIRAGPPDRPATLEKLTKYISPRLVPLQNKDEHLFSVSNLFSDIYCPLSAPIVVLKVACEYAGCQFGQTRTVKTALQAIQQAYGTLTHDNIPEHMVVRMLQLF